MRDFKKCLIIFTLVILLPFICIDTSFANNLDSKIYSPSCILIDSATGKILYEKNANKKMYPASTTKIMTAILAIENCNLTDIATVSYDAIFSVPTGYSHANLVEGEKLTIEQLLYCLLIPSANDAANVLAEHIGGSISKFADMMNEKAKELGCKNTNFVNAYGLHDKNHYSSAYDLALMGQYAMKNSTIRKIVETTQYTLPKTNKYNKENRIFNTTNLLLRYDSSASASNYYYEYANGIKTGYTEPAKDCIVASAKKDGLEVIVVILGADDTQSGLSARYLDCKTLFNYAFDNYSVRTVKSANSVLKQITIPGANKETGNLNVLIQEDINILLENSENNENLPSTVEINSDLKPPMAKGTVVGKISYTVNDITYTSNLIAGNDVEKSAFWDLLFRISLIIVVLYMLLKLLGIGKRKKKRRKSNNKKSKNKMRKSKRVKGTGSFKNVLSRYE